MRSTSKVITMPEPSDFDLDGAISAALDGDLDGFASDLGLDADTVRARLDTHPDASARRRALEATRAAVRQPVEAVDEVTRARLLTRATAPGGLSDQAPGTRGRGAIARIAAVAAIALLVVGFGVVAITRDDTTNAQKAVSGASHGPVRSGDIGDIGRIDQRKLDALIGGSPSKTAAPSVPQPEARQSSTLQSAAADSAVPGFDPSGALTATPEQVATCRKVYAGQGKIRFTGSGAYQDRPAVVIGLANGPRTIVFVLAANNCTDVLYSVSR